MEQIKDMFVKKQEMMKKMSTTTAPNPAELTAQEDLGLDDYKLNCNENLLLIGAVANISDNLF